MKRDALGSARYDLKQSEAVNSQIALASFQSCGIHLGSFQLIDNIQDLDCICRWWNEDQMVYLGRMRP